MIDLQHVSYAYIAEQAPVKVLQDIDLHVARGDTCAVIGPSGCGKSTLLKILAGILPDYAGTATLGGETICPARQRIGFLPQSYGLLQWKSVRENIELAGGQQQRVGLARAFLLRPDVLLMDEPFSALDAITREEMQEVFLSLWQEQHVTTLLVTHYVEEALYLGQKIVVLASAPGRIAEMLDNPLFGRSNSRSQTEFFNMSRYLREMIKKNRSGA